MCFVGLPLPTTTGLKTNNQNNKSKKSCSSLLQIVLNDNWFLWYVFELFITTTPKVYFPWPKITHSLVCYGTKSEPRFC